MRTIIASTLLLYLASASPNGYYHQQYNYKASSASYRNNELQHSNDDEGYYSKDGDFENRNQPRVNSHNQHSEYINPKMQHSYSVADRSSSFGQLHAGDAFNQEQAAYTYGGGGAAAIAATNLRHITAQLQEELVRELQRSVYDHYQRSSAYGTAITQAQIEADMRALEEEIRRNVTVRLQEALKTHYGNQGIRGGYSYTILDGRLQPTANYHNQELAELTRQMEAQLMGELQQQMQTYYHTTVNTEVHTRRNTYRRVNGAAAGGANFVPGPIQQPPPQMYPPMPHPPHPQPVHIPVHVPDSITTIATRVQTELNEHLNRILEDVEKRYFVSGSYHNLNNYNLDQILAQLQEELRANITFHLDDEIKRTYGFSNYASKYSVEDVENLRRQIEHNLMTKLNRDFNKQREKFFQSRMPADGPVIFQPRPMPIPANHVYYPVNNFHYQGDIGAIQRQLQETMQRQIQMALMQQSYRQAHVYGSNFNPETHYQATLQQLSEELNRNLTRHMEHLYNNRQYQHSGTFQAQLANMRNQLQMDLQRQLQQGLQQTYSRYSTWSSSSRSSNYRPVRGFDPNLYRNYGPTGNVAIVGDDCMMGDDPSVSRKKRSVPDGQVATTTSDDNILQQVETFDNQHGPTQQIQTHDALTQQAQSENSQDLTQETLEDQDLTQKVQSHDGLTKPQEEGQNRLVQTQQHPFQTESTLTQAHGLGQSTQDLDLHKPPITSPPYRYYTPIYRQRYTIPYYSQDSFSNYQPVRQRVQHYENLSNRSPYYPTRSYNQPLGQQVDNTDLTQQTVNEPQSLNQYRPERNNQYRPYAVNRPIQQSEPLGQQIEDTDLTQQSQTQSLNQYRQHTPDLSNQQQRPFHTQKPIQQSQPLGQQVDDTDLTQHTQTLSEPQSYNQYSQYSRPNLNNQYRPYSIQKPIQQSQGLGQQVVDPDLIQQSQTLNEPQSLNQYRQYTNIPESNNQRRPFSLQKPIQQSQPLGQQVEDTDLTQQIQPVNNPYRQYSTNNNNNQYRPYSTQQTQSLGQVEDTDLTQQTEPVNNPYRQYGTSNINKPYRQYSTQQTQQLGQQIEDTDLTQQTINEPQLNTQWTTPKPLQPLAQLTYRPQQNQQLGQQTEDDSQSDSSYTADLTQQTQNDDFSQQSQQNDDLTGQYRPHRNYWSQTQQQTDDLTQSRQPYSQNYGQYQPWNQQGRQYQPLQQSVVGQSQQLTPLSQSQQVDVFGQTQQTEDEDFGKLTGQQSHQVDTEGLTQQTEDDDFAQLNQQQRREPLIQSQSQWVDDIGLTQQTEDDLFAKLTLNKQPTTKPQYQQVEDVGLTQQTEEDDFAKLTQQKSQPLSHQLEDQNLTQQTEDDDFGKQTEDVEQPIEPQTSTQKSQSYYQFNSPAEQPGLREQTQSFMREEINQEQQQVEEGEETTPSNKQSDIERKNQQLIDLLKNHNKQKQQSENISQVDTTSQGPPQPPYYYYNSQGPSGRSLINKPTTNINQAKVEEEEALETETVQDLEPVEPQVASEVQQVDVKGSAKTEEPVSTQVPEVVTTDTTVTTPAPGFWSKLGTSIKNKAIEYKEKIG